MKYTAARGPSDQPARDMGGRREGSGAECSTLNLTTLSPRPWVGGAVERGLEKAEKRTWRLGAGAVIGTRGAHDDLTSSPCGRSDAS
jgi:hypothetical protein